VPSAHIIGRKPRFISSSLVILVGHAGVITASPGTLVSGSQLLQNDGKSEAATPHTIFHGNFYARGLVDQETEK
jgi:hypothetical protein